MVIGYFLFEIFMLATVNGTSVNAGFVAATAGLIPNIIQGIFGVVIATVLYPLLTRISKQKRIIDKIFHQLKKVESPIDSIGDSFYSNHIFVQQVNIF